MQTGKNKNKSLLHDGNRNANLGQWGEEYIPEKDSKVYFLQQKYEMKSKEMSYYLFRDNNSIKYSLDDEIIYK